MLDIEKLKEKIVEVRYRVDSVGGEPRQTTCTLITKLGSMVTGESFCMDSKDFVRETGEEVAYKRAFEKLCELEAYHQKETNERQRKIFYYDVGNVDLSKVRELFNQYELKIKGEQHESSNLR